MKKSLLIIALGLFVFTTGLAQTHFGIKGGLNFGNFSKFVGAKPQTSFHVIGFADISLSNRFSIQPGLALQGKGFRVAESQGYSSNFYNGYYTELSRNVFSIELPVNIIHYVPVGTGKVYFGAGPYIGIHVSGSDKITRKSDYANPKVKGDLSFTGQTKMMNLLDAGANFVLGYKLNKGLLINGGYNLGLNNIVAMNDLKSSHRVLSFGLGYQF